MRKTSIKTISRLLVLVMLLTSVLALFGCDFLNMQSDQTTTTTQRKDKKAEDLIKDMKEKMVAAGYEEMKMRAEYYFQDGGLNWRFSYDVEIIDDTLFVDGVMFDEIIYDSEYELSFFMTMTRPDLVPDYDKEKVETINKIQEERGFYIIKAQSLCKVGKEIVIYEEGNTYYLFAIFYDDNVIYRAHKVTIN